ncbi:MAG: type I-E CRISPR-associated protein Cse1/CasA [Armatimonadota bacterium]
MNKTFNLLKEPWIHVVQDNELVEMNLRDVLCLADKISEISDPLPIVEFGLSRLLVALVMDVFHLYDSRDSFGLRDLLNTGHFDPAQIDEYFEVNGPYFDLFDAKRPFLQMADVDSPVKPLSGLLSCVPSGTAATHFHHYGEMEFSVSPAAAARLLTTIAPFMTAGGAGLAPSINGAPPWYVLVRGENLFETICLNCFVGNTGLSGDAPPAWRNPLPPKTDGRCAGASLPEALTWRPRLIQLIPGNSGVCSMSGEECDVLVQTMRFKAGASCNFAWTDPNVPYKYSEKGALVMRPQDGREIWRDTGPLALLNDNAYKSSDAKVKFSRPLIVDQFQELYSHKDKPFSFAVYGMRTDMKMKVFEWQKEVLSVPVELVIGQNHAIFAQDFIDEADKVEYALRKAIKHLYPRDGAGNSNAFESVIANARRQYWSHLRPHYNDLLKEMAKHSEDELAEAKYALQDEWRTHEKKAAMEAFHTASEDLDTYAENIRRQAEAGRQLQSSINGVFLSPEEKAARKKSKTRRK